MHHRAAILLALALALTACTANRQRAAYQTLDTTATLVEAAAKTLGLLNAHGKLTPAQYDQAAAIYQDYQAAMDLAIELAQGDPQAYTPDKVLALANQLIALIERWN